MFPEIKFSSQPYVYPPKLFSIFFHAPECTPLNTWYQNTRYMNLNLLPESKFNYWFTTFKIKKNNRGKLWSNLCKQSVSLIRRSWRFLLFFFFSTSTFQTHCWVFSQHHISLLICEEIRQVYKMENFYFTRANFSVVIPWT